MMNTSEFLDMTRTAGRKLIEGNNRARDIQILNNGSHRYWQFLIAYHNKYEKLISKQQSNIIKDLMLLCKQPMQKENYENIIELINTYATFGVNFLVRHPEPLLSSYEKKPGRNLTVRGVFQVWTFNRFMKRFLDIYSDVDVHFFYSRRIRTRKFAELCNHYLKRHSGLSLHNPKELDCLMREEQMEDMKKRYAELPVQKPLTHKKMRIIRNCFKRWFKDSPMSRAVANEIKGLLNNHNGINIYFSHENVIGSYLYHVKKTHVDESLIKYTGYIVSTNGKVFVDF